MTALARIQPANTVDLIDDRPVNQWIELLVPAAELARQIAETDFVPKEMRNRPAAITACILYGAEIGIGPMQSLAKVDIINGRPAPRAELGRALALGAGHEIWVDESTNTRVKVSGRRRGSDKVQTATWTLDDVKKAGISNANYAKYPRQMLLARASAELVRMLCPDVLGGVTMFAEEAADVDAVEVTAADVAPVKATTRRRATTATTLPQDTPEPPPLPDDNPPATGGPTEPQIKKMMATFNELGLKDRDDRLSFAISVVGHPVTTTKDLTVEEAGRVIDALDRVAGGTLDIILVDGKVTLEANDLPPLPDDL